MKMLPPKIYIFNVNNLEARYLADTLVNVLAASQLTLIVGTFHFQIPKFITSEID